MEMQHPWDIYPRPLLQRDSFIPLNGLWDLKRVTKEAVEEMGEILVPYPPESALSGIQKTLKKGQRWIYGRRFRAPEMKETDRLILHFGAVDQIARINVNGIPLLSHEGGYLPFEVDVTPALVEGENLLEVLVEDDHKKEYPLGKQSLKRGGMWYTAHSGIWQSVWMEVVPENAFKNVEVETTLSQVILHVEGARGMKKLTILDKVYAFSGNSIRIKLEDPILWTPENPHLYTFTLENKTDKIASYFAVRTISIEEKETVHGEKGKYLCLNGKPVFLHGLLDQGYYADGIVLPKSPEGYREDIARMKAMGFNMLRKHIKIEPEVFYYECDRQGMLVMQDLVNSGTYSFLRDSALPTIGITHLPRHKASRKRRDRFEADAAKTVDLAHKHPCVYGITIFNEGWGQYDADKLYDLLKQQEPELIFDTASGWFDSSHTDVISRHIYFKKIRLKRPKDKPLTLSEYGGYSLQTPGHIFNPDKVWGYKKFEDRSALEEGLSRLIREEVIPSIDAGLSAAVLTQVSDVEDETNGMFTYDREVVKVDPEKMKELAAELFEVFDKQFE